MVIARSTTQMDQCSSTVAVNLEGSTSAATKFLGTSVFLMGHTTSGSSKTRISMGKDASHCPTARYWRANGPKVSLKVNHASSTPMAMSTTAPYRI